MRLSAESERYHWHALRLIVCPASLFVARAEWLEKGSVKKLVLVISGVEKNEVLERWVFDVSTDDKAVSQGSVARTELSRRGAASAGTMPAVCMRGSQ